VIPDRDPPIVMLPPGVFVGPRTTFAGLFGSPFTIYVTLYERNAKSPPLNLSSVDVSPVAVKYSIVNSLFGADVGPAVVGADVGPAVVGCDVGPAVVGETVVVGAAVVVGITRKLEKKTHHSFAAILVTTADPY
jgi:hypothetical protein